MYRKKASESASQASSSVSTPKAGSTKRKAPETPSAEDPVEKVSRGRKKARVGQYGADGDAGEKIVEGTVHTCWFRSFLRPVPVLIYL